jgi:hypothetical protein
MPWRNHGDTTGARAIHRNRRTFALADPTVERAIVRFTKMDFGGNPRERVYDLADGPRAACSNPRCHRGGYDLIFSL